MLCYVISYVCVSTCNYCYILCWDFVGWGWPQAATCSLQAEGWEMLIHAGEYSLRIQCPQRKKRTINRSVGPLSMNKLSNHQRSHVPKTLVGSSPCEPTQRNELSNGNMACIVIWAFHVHKAQLCPQWDRRCRFAAFGFSGFPACTWFPHVSTAV